MDNQTKLRIGGLLVLTTAVLSLIIVLIVDSWPLAILLAVIIVAAAAGGFVWTSRRQQRQFLERLKKFDIDPEKGRINEANLRRMYHSGGQHQKRRGNVGPACRKNARLTKRTPCSKNARPVRK